MGRIQMVELEVVDVSPMSCFSPFCYHSRDVGGGSTDELLWAPEEEGD